MRVLVTCIRDEHPREKQSKEAVTRKSLVGSSDRLRTYNFPQGRMTDHRINRTLYKHDCIVDGDLVDLTNGLVAEHQVEFLATLGDD